MGYLEWIRALDRAHQYASLNGDKLTHLCLDGATFDLNGFFSHADVSAYVRAEIIGQNGNSGEHYPERYKPDSVRCNDSRTWRKRETGYFVYCKKYGWQHSETVPPEVKEFFDA